MRGHGRILDFRFFFKVITTYIDREMQLLFVKSLNPMIDQFLLDSV